MISLLNESQYQTCRQWISGWKTHCLGLFHWKQDSDYTTQVTMTMSHCHLKFSIQLLHPRPAWVMTAVFAPSGNMVNTDL